MGRDVSLESDSVADAAMPLRSKQNEATARKLLQMAIRHTALCQMKTKLRTKSLSQNGFGYIKRVFLFGDWVWDYGFSKTKNNFIKIFKNRVKSVYKVGCK